MKGRNLEGGGGEIRNSKSEIRNVWRCAPGAEADNCGDRKGRGGNGEEVTGGDV